MIYKLIVFLFPLCAWAFVNQNGDFQIWFRSEIWKYFSPRGFCLTEAEARWGDDASKLFLTYLQAQLGYQPVAWFYLAPGYRQQFQRYPAVSNHWKLQYMPLIDANFFWPQSLMVSDRNRLVYSILDSIETFWVYRNRFRFIMPWSFAYSRINPYIENEIFIRQGFGFNQDRAAGGFMITVTEHLVGRIYYMCRFEKTQTKSWVQQNILGIGLVGNF